MTMNAMSFLNRAFDADMEFKDDGLIAASATWEVDSAAKVVDVGAGMFQGFMIVDASAIEIATGDESYDIVIQGSPVAAFTAAGIVDLATLHLGAKGTKRTDCDRDDTAGRYILPFTNMYDSTLFRYLRGYTVVAGTIATGINFTAFAVPSTGM